MLMVVSVNARARECKRVCVCLCVIVLVAWACIISSTCTYPANVYRIGSRVQIVCVCVHMYACSGVQHAHVFCCCGLLVHVYVCRIFVCFYMPADHACVLIQTSNRAMCMRYICWMLMLAGDFAAQQQQIQTHNVCSTRAVNNAVKIDSGSKTGFLLYWTGEIEKREKTNSQESYPFKQKKIQIQWISAITLYKSESYRLYWNEAGTFQWH